jgi:hypothetical protein
MSKIAIFQHVARRVLRLTEDPKVAVIFDQADAAHVLWQTQGANGYWACTDQILNGVTRGSRYYPRVITTTLWLNPIVS